MKRLLSVIVSLASCVAVATQADAYESKKKNVISAQSGVDGEVSPVEVRLDTRVVKQQTGEAVASLTFPSGNGGSTDFRDSHLAIEVGVTANQVGNRVIIYTDNESIYDGNPQSGIDGGGLVGVTDGKTTVPLVWGVGDTNENYDFGTPKTLPEVGSAKGILVTDQAHVATFVDAALGRTASATEKDELDTLAMANCASRASVPNAPSAGTLSDPERYPQFFGTTGANNDLCYNGPATSLPLDIRDKDGKNIAKGLVTATCFGVSSGACPEGSKLPFAEELSKNIAVVASGFTGDIGSAPNTLTEDSEDFIDVTSPFYVAIGGDFRRKPAQMYTTNQLILELVAQ